MCLYCGASLSLVRRTSQPSEVPSEAPHRSKQAFDVAAPEPVLLLRTDALACEPLNHTLIYFALASRSRYLNDFA